MGANCPALTGCGNNYIIGTLPGAESCGGFSPGEYCTTYNGKEYGGYSCVLPGDFNSFECSAGYTKKLKSSSVLGCTYQYVECEEEVSCSGWSVYDTTYMLRTCTSYSGRNWEEVKCRTSAYGSPQLVNGTPTGCNPCPDYASCTGGTTFTCLEGSYKNGSVCTDCPPLPGASPYSNMGSTKVTDCYIMSSEPISDSTGTWHFTSNCPYTE